MTASSSRFGWKGGTRGATERLQGAYGFLEGTEALFRSERKHLVDELKVTRVRRMGLLLGNGTSLVSLGDSNGVNLWVSMGGLPALPRRLRRPPSAE